MSIALTEISWQARADRLGRLLLLPILALSTVLAALATSGGYRSWAGFHPGFVWVGIAAIWSAALSRYPVSGVPDRTRLLVFSGHTVLAGTLVWVSPWFGVFAFTGYFFADELTKRWRTGGYALVAVVMAASQTGGYPTGWTVHVLVYVLLLTFNLVAVLSMVSLTNRVMEQSAERGLMIDELGEANRRLEASMSENAGLHAQLLVQAREAGVVDERQRLAGEIHDTLAQGLTGIIAQLEAARRARDNTREWCRHLDLADSLARDSLTEARRSVRALRPEQLEDASLPEALHALAHNWSQRSAVAAEFETTGTPIRADADVEATVFRVAQEALSNVARHASSSRVHITLSYLDDTLLLDVADDGIGFHPTDTAGGFGLTGMQRRLDGVSGTLNVESAPGYGTTINAAVPLRKTRLGAVR